MTRINVGIRPVELTNKHLIAEHREIKRIPNCITKGRFDMRGQPEAFKLGKGHVKFFYDKLGYLKQRYELLYLECLNRGFNVQYYGNAWDGISPELMGGYEPTSYDREIIQERINNRLNTKNK